MQSESQIPIASQDASKRFATRVALFYGTLFGMTGTHLPFFTVWLKAVGIDAFWIGLITAVPPVTRFTVLPLVTGLAERRQALRGAIIVTAFATALGFFILGTQHLPVPVFLIPLVGGFAGLVFGIIFGSVSTRRGGTARSPVCQSTLAPAWSTTRKTRPRLR